MTDLKVYALGPVGKPDSPREKKRRRIELEAKRKVGITI